MTALTARQLAEALGKARREGNEWRALCPAHSDHDPSLSIGERDGKLYVCCRAGCDQQAVIDALIRRNLWGDPDRKKDDDWEGRIDTTYDYVDENGRRLFQVCRLIPKSFRQRHYDGTRWIKNMEGVRRVPYRLDELVAAVAAGKRVHIVEGEKDADKLVGGWGLCATTNPMGAGEKKWLPEYNSYFKGADVVIIPDNDAVGRAHAIGIAKQLLKIARSIKVLRLEGLAEHGDISDWIADGGTQGTLEDLIDGWPEFDPDVDEPLVPEGQPEVKWAGDDDSPIPPRPWLLGTNFCRGYLSGLTGAGATGKTALRLAQLIDLALGRGDLTGDHVFKRTKVLVVCLEDDELEWRRRVAAVCIKYQIDQKELIGWLAFWTPRDLRLLEVDLRGEAQPGGLGDALKRIIKRLRIGLVCVDPFVKSHGASENDNVLVDRAATLFLQVAHDCGCACDYIHHHKKGINLAGDQDASRGASSLGDASRIVKTVTRMTDKEAEAFGVSERERRFFIRLDDAKVNIAPPADQAVWFKLVGVDLNNGTTDYPNGDNVQTVERWYPPTAKDLSKADLMPVFDAIRNGPSSGEFYSADPQSNSYWVVPVIQQITGFTETQAERLVNDWIKNRVLIEDKYISPARRHRERSRVTINEGKVIDMLGSLYEPPEGGI